MLDPSASLIKEGMPVVCSDDRQLAVVDHMEGTDIIKLARDETGRHHYIPLTWVSGVDDKVHLDRPGDRAKEEWFTAPAAKATAPDAAAGAAHPVNSVDATAGQPIAERVQTRKRELEALLPTLPADHHSRADIELALGTIDGLLTGDLARVPAVVAAEMNTWLERNKHLGERAVPPTPEGEPDDTGEN